MNFGEKGEVYNIGSGFSVKLSDLLEKILLELGRLSRLEVTEPFRVIGEQIDGAVKYDPLPERISEVRHGALQKKEVINWIGPIVKQL